MLYRPIQAKMSRRACSRVANRVCVTSSLFRDEKNDSTTLLSQHYPANRGLGPVRAAEGMGDGAAVESGGKSLRTEIRSVIADCLVIGTMPV